MIFVPLIFVAVFLYAKSYKISALVIFFFLITSGFDLIPENMFDLGIGISKGSDLAFFTLFGCVFVDIAVVKNYLRIDGYSKFIYAFLGFLFICILHSKFVMHLNWNEIIRTSRFFFFVFAYFVFRNMKEEELAGLLKVLFCVTFVLSVLFLFQIVIGKNILLKQAMATFSFGSFKVYRFYNQPTLIFFMGFMAIYKNPLKGIPKIITSIIIVAAFLGAFHRSVFICFIIAVTIGYIIRLPQVKRVKVILISTAFLIPGIAFVGYKFVRSKTYTDIQSVMSGGFVNMEVDMETLHKSTFTFRIGILFEKIQYLSNNPKAQLLGAGLITEDSKKTDSIFEFAIGLAEEYGGRTVQIESGDISYSSLILRLGYVGLALYMMVYLYPLYYFYKKRKNETAFYSLIFLLFSLGVSFFTSNLAGPHVFLMTFIAFAIVSKQEANKKEEQDSVSGGGEPVLV